MATATSALEQDIDRAERAHESGRVRREIKESVESILPRIRAGEQSAIHGVRVMQEAYGLALNSLDAEAPPELGQTLAVGLERIQQELAALERFTAAVEHPETATESSEPNQVQAVVEQPNVHQESNPKPAVTAESSARDFDIRPTADEPAQTPETEPLNAFEQQVAQQTQAMVDQILSGYDVVDAWTQYLGEKPDNQEAAAVVQVLRWLVGDNQIKGAADSLIVPPVDTTTTSLLNDARVQVIISSLRLTEAAPTRYRYLLGAFTPSISGN